jgi:hypothetical protein
MGGIHILWSSGLWGGRPRKVLRASSPAQSGCPLRVTSLLNFVLLDTVLPTWRTPIPRPVPLCEGKIYGPGPAPQSGRAEELPLECHLSQGIGNSVSHPRMRPGWRQVGTGLVQLSRPAWPAFAALRCPGSATPGGEASPRRWNPGPHRAPAWQGLGARSSAKRAGS